jgi:lipoprotein-anchoring transpeptidase ErfK/SrfK
MGRKTLIGTVIGVLLLLGVAVGAYAWDASKADEIAEGVHVGGVDVGGLSEDEAAKLLRSELVEPLSEPVVVKYEGEDYTLHASDLNVRADVDGMVSEATAASREGALPTRVWRYATGGEVDAAIKPRVSYSETAVDRFVEGVAAKVNTEPQDASIEPTTTSLNPVPGEEGIAVREEQLRERIDAVLQHGGRGSRVVHATVETVKPDVTTEELAAEYPTYITVDRASFTLRLFKDLKPAGEYPIAVGTIGFDTPAGLYHIQNKAVDPAWSVPEWGGSLAGQVIPGGTPENPLKERWLGIYDGAGIHGTDDVASLGTAASHGCIRMAIPDVIELYDQVPVGAPIYIQ